MVDNIGDNRWTMHPCDAHNARMRRDGRALDHETLEAIRLTAVRRVRDGEKPAVVIAGYGFSRTTIYKWLKASSGRGKGLRG